MSSKVAVWVLFWALFLLFLAPPPIGQSNERQTTRENFFFNLVSVGKNVPEGFVDPRPMVPTAASVAIRVACGVGLAFILLFQRRAVITVLTRYFSAADSAVNLAIFRIIVYAALFREVFLRPVAVFYPREFTAGFSTWWMPETVRLPAVFLTMKWILLAACICGIGGLWPRLSGIVAVVMSLYVLGTTHAAFNRSTMTTHHFLWFTALLAASPCTDVLSLDALWRTRGSGRSLRARLLPPLPPHLAYGLPLRTAWFLMGVIFFFPGVWKLWVAGWEWTSPANFGNILHLYWNVYHFLPLVRVDELPLALRFLGVWTIIFELTFIFCIFSPRLRPWCALEGISFLLGVHVVMGVGFSVGLAFCHISLFNWTPWVERLWSARADVPPPRASFNVWPCAIVAGILIAANTACGVLKIQGWPFTTYPAFAGLLGPSRPEMFLYVRHADGREVEIRPRHEEVNFYVLRCRALRVWDDLPPHRRAVLVKWFYQFYDSHLEPGDTLRCYADWQWTAPPWGRSLLNAPVLLLELPAADLSGVVPREELDQADD